MADSEMTDADRAYAVAQELIAEALAEGKTALVFDHPETRSLEILPPEISELRDVTFLDLDFTNITDLGPLCGLSKLQQLTLNNTPVSDLGALSDLSGLQQLYLNDTQVSDLSGLSGLGGLKELYLENTHVRDLRPLRHLVGLLASDVEFPVLFDGSVADLEFPEIDKLYEMAPEGERVQALFDYLETWAPPEERFKTPDTESKPAVPPGVPAQKPAPLRSGFADGRMVRLPPEHLPEDDVLARAEKGWQALKAYRAAFGDSFNVHNYAPLPSFLAAFDREMGEHFDAEKLIMIGVMGTRIIGLSQNKDFLASLPTGADTDLQGFAASIALYLERFKDWTDYQEDAARSDVTLASLAQHAEVFDAFAQSLKDTPEVDTTVADEYAAELAETRQEEADNAVAKAFEASNRETLRNLAEKAVDEVQSGRAVRKSVAEMDKIADGEFAKVKFYSYGWTLVLLKRNRASLERLEQRYPWLKATLDWLVSEEEKPKDG